MKVKDTMKSSLRVKNFEVKIYTATRQLKWLAEHLQLPARTSANQGTNKATKTYNLQLGEC